MIERDGWHPYFVQSALDAAAAADPPTLAWYWRDLLPDQLASCLLKALADWMAAGAVDATDWQWWVDPSTTPPVVVVWGSCLVKLPPGAEP